MKSIFWNGDIAFLLFSKNRPFSIKQFFHNRKCMNTWNILHFSLLLNYCLSLDEYCEYWLGRTKYIYTATSYFIVETNVYYLTDSLERKQYNVSAKHLLVFFLWVQSIFSLSLSWCWFLIFCTPLKKIIIVCLLCIAVESWVKNTEADTASVVVWYAWMYARLLLLL